MNKKILTPLLMSAALILGGALMILPGCAGGCGEDNSGKPAADEGGASQSTSKSGGGQAGLSRYDSGGKSTSTAMGQAGEVGAQLSAGPVKAVGPEDFKAKVLKEGATVFLTVSRANCEDCATMAPVMKALAPQFASVYNFYELDGMAVGASGLLPPSIALEPLPAFVMYKNGKPTSYIQGLPFERDTDAKGSFTEPLPDYQRRLMRWFHDAMVQKNLNFSRTIRKAPAKKT